jgi:hypothetical protein
MKIVVNRCYGGYGLSRKAYEYLGMELEADSDCGYDFADDRTNPKLIKVVEKLGKEANSFLSDLEVVEIPDGIEWEIEEYDGRERVAEKHRTW